MSARPESGARLQRVLALVPWIAAHPGVTLDELAARFEIEREELEEDLELLPMCGLPPYTADRLIDLVVADDGAVSVRLAEYFERPLRLTPAEGVALLAAGRALLGVPGSDPEGPLATGLAKLEHALGATGALAIHVAGADHLQQLRDAVEAGRQVEIDYYSSARDEMTTRVVDPVRVFHALGAWYLAGWCHRATGDRLFRIDRVRGVRPTGRSVEPSDDGSRPERDADLVYRPAADDPRVTLRLDREAAWVAESIPVESRRDATRREDRRRPRGERPGVPRAPRPVARSPGDRARTARSACRPWPARPDACWPGTSAPGPEHRIRATRAPSRRHERMNGRGARRVTGTGPDEGLPVAASSADTTATLSPGAVRVPVVAPPPEAPAKEGRRVKPPKPKKPAWRVALEWVVLIAIALGIALADQELPVPGLLHPVGVDEADAQRGRPRPREQALVRPARREPRRHRRLRSATPRAERRHRGPREARDRATGRDRHVS